jgi:cytochrome P450
MPRIVTCARTVEGKAFTFHDGLQLPCGSRIIYPALAIHMDPANYKDPETFEPFRFVKSDDTKSIAASTVTSTFLQ